VMYIISLVYLTMRELFLYVEWCSYVISRRPDILSSLADRG